MYTIPVSMRNKFLTGDYIPVSNALKSRYYSNGGVSEVTIVKAGQGYNQANASLYGANAQARAAQNIGSILGDYYKTSSAANKTGRANDFSENMQQYGV
jgi:hypothetical protein